MRISACQEIGIFPASRRHRRSYRVNSECLRQSAVVLRADSNRTSLNVAEVPKPDSCGAAGTLRQCPSNGISPNVFEGPGFWPISRRGRRPVHTALDARSNRRCRLGSTTRPRWVSGNPGDTSILRCDIVTVSLSLKGRVNRTRRCNKRVLVELAD